MTNARANDADSNDSVSNDTDSNDTARNDTAPSDADASGSVEGSDPIAAFERIDVRVGTVVEASAFEGGRTSTHVLRIDLGGDLGTKKSLARLPRYDPPAMLVGRQVLCLVGLEPRQIGGHMSEVLTLAVPDANGDTVLVAPDRDVPDGGRLH